MNNRAPFAECQAFVAGSAPEFRENLDGFMGYLPAPIRLGHAGLAPGDYPSLSTAWMSARM